MAFTKNDLRHLRRARNVVNRRIARLERAGLDDIPSINLLRGAFGGAKRIPKIPAGIYDDEFEDISKYIYNVFNDPRTTLSGAKAFDEGRRQMIKDMFKGIGIILSDEEINIVKDYIPYEDFREFLIDYIYEHVVSTAASLIKAEVPYRKEYMQTALESSVRDVYATILKENGVNKSVIEYYVDRIVSGDTITYVLGEYRSAKEND